MSCLSDGIRKFCGSLSGRQAAVCAGIAAVLLAAFWRMPDLKEKINELIMTYLPYFVFIMYAINRGTGFTRALFVNCDHSLLTYSFYKQPRAILRCFRSGCGRLSKSTFCRRP